MPRLIDADIFYDNIVEGTDLGAEDNVDEALKRYLDLEPTVEAIPKEICGDILQYLEYSYMGAKAMKDMESMIRIARAIEAYKLDVEKDCVIKESEDGDK